MTQIAGRRLWFDPPAGVTVPVRYIVEIDGLSKIQAEAVYDHLEAWLSDAGQIGTLSVSWLTNDSDAEEAHA